MKHLLRFTGILFCLISAPAMSTHIVGGNFVVVQTAANTFTITVKVYRDCSPSSAAMPASLDVGIYNLTTNALQQQFTMFGPVVTTVVLGDECYTPTGICIQEGIFTTTVTIPDNAGGYYLETELFARNNIITNIVNPGGTGMTFYAEIPDPALAGMNSTPDFGAYPSDGYLCISYAKTMNFGVTDPDGDSLSYDLVDPLNSNLLGNGTSPAPYSAINWQAPYSLANIVGGSPPMVIDPVTGDITAQPTALGTFVFAVRVTEWRNGVKIGEVRRDVQYTSLNCTFDDLPEIHLPDSMYIEVNSSGCFDIVVLDQDATDTVSILVSSATFAQGAVLTLPPPSQTSPDTLYMFHFTNDLTGMPDSVELPAATFLNGAYFGEGGVGLTYCWETDCSDLNGSPYTFDVNAFSIGCSGDTNFLQQTVNLVVTQPTPSQETIYLQDTVWVEANKTGCFDIVVQNSDPTDSVSILVESISFLDDDAQLVNPPLYSSNPDLYQYITWNDTAYLPLPTYSNGAYYGVGGVGLRYCWVTDCENISDFEYQVIVSTFEIGCFGDTSFIRDTSRVFVYPPPGQQDVIPNVFTPNGDGINDMFKIDGLVNICYDTMDVQIFNRWGQLVYQSNEPGFEWDGKDTNGSEVTEGTYFVIMRGRFGDKDVDKHYPLTLFRKKK